MDYRIKNVFMILYNIYRRGLTRIAYPVTKQCESLDVG